MEAREPVKEIDYQVQLRIIEARQLSGMQLDPVCTVTISNQKKHTAVKEQTNTPFWDEFFVFDFKMPASVLFDKIINFQVFTGRNLVSQGILIGSFKVFPSEKDICIYFMLLFFMCSFCYCWMWSISFTF